MITKLCEYAGMYKTDKAGWYTPFYSMLLDPYRQKFKRILEIGIGTKQAMAHVPDYMPGASLFMWRDFFPNAQIFGMDIDPSTIFESERITCLLDDSRWAEPEGKFDLIIDDGSHEKICQFQTFCNLFRNVKDNGFYIIEDAESWSDLAEMLEGYFPTVILSYVNGAVAKAVLIRK